MVQSGLPIQNIGVIRDKVLEEHELEVHSKLISKVLRQEMGMSYRRVRGVAP